MLGSGGFTADAAEPVGGGTVDKFRIKIWNISSGVVVYGNKIGVSEDIDQTDPQAIEGGSIVIHNK